MIRYFAKENGHLVELQKLKAGCWINISQPVVQDELLQISERYNIPVEFLTDSLDIDERSRYEKEDDGRLIIINSPIINKVNPDTEAFYITIPIGIILVEDHVITITGYENPILANIIDGRFKNFDPREQGRFVVKIFERNVLRFLQCLKDLNVQRNNIEKSLYNSSKNSDLKQLLSIEKSLVYFVNSLSANELLKLKIKRTDFLSISGDEMLEDLFEDVVIDNGQALEMSNVYTNILSGVMDAYTSIISNNLNMVIQRLTLVTIILMVPTLIASFYGMNVPMPFAKKEWAFYLIVFLSIVISLLLAGFFRRRKLI